MPYAGASDKTFELNLKSIEGGWVKAKRLTYGQKLQRTADMKMNVEMGGNAKDFKGELNMANLKATYSEYAACIVDHNLEKDQNGTKFDFTNSSDVDGLAPQVGEEITKWLESLNNFEDTDEAKN